MGRVGRACLYASFTLGVSAASVLAASQEALPGDALYGLKQRVEQLRMDVVPDQFKAELAAYALGERIEEMSRLADSGRLELAIAMGPSIEREFQHVAALGRADDPARAARIARHLLVLEGLLETATGQCPRRGPGRHQRNVRRPGQRGCSDLQQRGWSKPTMGAVPTSNAGPGPASEPDPPTSPTGRRSRTDREARADRASDPTPKPATDARGRAAHQPVEIQSSD